MNLASLRSPVCEQRPGIDSEADRIAVELIDTLTALPPGHPGRDRLRDEAIEAWLPMAHRLAQRYASRGEPVDDLRQIATIGLIKAVDRYDAGQGIAFVGYAIPTVIGEIKRYFRDHTWSIRVPRRLQEMRITINRANTTLAHRLRRAPTVADIASYLNVTEEEVLEGLEGARAYHATSLSLPTTIDGSLELGDTLGALDSGYELTEQRLSLRPALAALNEREQRILTLRYYGNQTQAQIAEQVGVSQMHVSRLITKALGQLRDQLQLPTD